MQIILQVKKPIGRLVGRYIVWFAVLPMYVYTYM